MSRQLMGLREYARHREASGLPGTTLAAVQKAASSGRITLVADDKGRPKVDPEVADIQWGRNTDAEQSARANAGRDPSPPSSDGRGGQGGERDGSAYWDARTRREQAEASRAELELQRMQGDLVSRDRVERAASETGRLLRDMVLSVPSRVASEVAAMTDPVAVEARLRAELRGALEDVSRLAKTGIEQATH